jgi:cell wall-associated NlpC family hydrolase
MREHVRTVGAAVTALVFILCTFGSQSRAAAPKPTAKPPAKSSSKSPGAGNAIDAKRKEAVRLEAEVGASGERLSRAAEDYDEAQIGRERLDSRLASLELELDAAQAHWTQLKGQLGERVREIYMHPGGWASPILNAGSLAAFERGRVMAGSVLDMDNDLILDTERARARTQQVRSDVQAARNLARQNEKDTAARRSAVESALQAQRALLSRVRGELAQLIEQERKRRLEEAARRAAAGVAAGRARGNVGLPAPKNVGPVRPAAQKAISTAAAQLGKPYQWAASGPGSFDCSGLTMYSWGAAGVSLPHSSRAQYSSLPHVANDQIQPGDLLFYGRPIHHVGIYEGGGVMINAPETGETVRRASIYRSDFAGAARP